MSLNEVLSLVEDLEYAEEESYSVLNKSEENKKGGFSWSDVLFKLVIATLAIIVIAVIVLLAAPATAVAAAVAAATAIVFSGWVLFSINELCYDMANSGWETALGNLGENIMVLCAIPLIGELLGASFVASGFGLAAPATEMSFFSNQFVYSFKFTPLANSTIVNSVGRYQAYSITTRLQYAINGGKNIAVILGVKEVGEGLLSGNIAEAISDAVLRLLRPIDFITGGKMDELIDFGDEK